MTLKRKSPLRRTLPASQGRTPIKRKARKPSEYARIYGSKARVKFINALPCANCGMHGEAGGWREMVNAHTETGGTSRKADAETIVPLCSTLNRGGCHDIQHDCGWSALPKLDTPDKRIAAAANCEARWQFRAASSFPETRSTT